MRYYRKYIGVFLKLILSVSVSYILYRQIIGRENVNELWEMFLGNLSPANTIWLCVALLLVPLNWSLEAQKWRELMHRIEEIPFGLALKAVFAGVTFSILTPNRIGEYGGRVLMVTSDKVSTVVATLVGSFSQMVVLMGIGVWSMLYYFYQLSLLPELYWWLMSAMSVVGGAVMLFFYYNIDLAIPVIQRIPYLNQHIHRLYVLKEYTPKQLSKVLLYSFLRYCVYSLQYFFLLRFFGISVSLWSALTNIAFIFFLQTVLPSLPATGLFLRAEVALNIWGSFTENEIAILAVTFGLWLMNVALPAIIGMIFIIRVNVLKNFGYENRD